ncbi:TetR/AcrR family transcriptional regulator [Gordonia sp. (in: high G+C Gram-positive bacteria)]|uniref:TetR/AcrR family transcriptional regulator n=1 Tax=Gordonia sp. (in: high G+C Gram-positive bacteria) TaxID=84139 RepID=UPI0016A7ED00|nr:TetR/AcrR family transcriptional regulator [Gordonia sp. (in: high G+C Gram-positive bacteria)]NLG48163.1 TetR/AcrR family transcriptional regulator [Gordonia sp. (in: high G+C Gram-positive bacteria)]
MTEDPGPGGPAATRSETTRRRLLDAALVAFAERGFHGTTTRDIAGAAGMSPAAVYVHYRSKEELLFALSRAGHEATIGVLDAADDPDASPADRLDAVMRAFAQWHADGHTSARIVNYELEALEPDHHSEILVLRREITRRVRAIVDAGIANGGFDVDDPHTTTNSLLSMGIDIARWYSKSGPLSPEQIGDFYAMLALRVVGAPPRT